MRSISLPFLAALIAAAIPTFASADEMATAENGAVVTLLDGRHWRSEVFRVEHGSTETVILEDGREAILEGSTWRYAPGSTSRSFDHPANPRPGFDFRRARWGMRREEVLATEPTPPRINTESSIIWMTKLAGFETGVGYLFHEGKLAIGGYIFRENHPANIDYLRDNDDLKRLLVEKYGEPREDSKDWKVDDLKSKPERWGDAVARGDVVMRSEWFLSGTVIRLELTSDKGKVRHRLSYHSNALLAEERRRRHRKNLDDL